jgi:hypothetical protein
MPVRRVQTIGVFDAGHQRQNLLQRQAPDLRGLLDHGVVRRIERLGSRQLRETRQISGTRPVYHAALAAHESVAQRHGIVTRPDRDGLGRHADRPSLACKATLPSHRIAPCTDEPAARAAARRIAAARASLGHAHGTRNAPRPTEAVVDIVKVHRERPTAGARRGKSEARQNQTAQRARSTSSAAAFRQHRTDPYTHPRRYPMR